MFDLRKSGCGRVVAVAARRLGVLLFWIALGVAPAWSAPKHAKATPAPTPEAQTSPTPTAAPPAAPEVPPLTEHEIASADATDAFTVPTPGELFATLNRQAKPNWGIQYRGPINTAYSDRSQVALNLGGLIADGFVAVEAADAQQVKNLGRDILGLAKNLGISKEILARANSITQFADDNDWSSLKEELEATQNEVKQAMDNLHDDDLITLLTIGGWIRGTEVVSDIVLRNYSGQTASILRQPYLVKYLETKLDGLSPKTKDTPLLKAVGAGLDRIGAIVTFPRGSTMTKENVQLLHDAASELVKVMANKSEK